MWPSPEKSKSNSLYNNNLNKNNSLIHEINTDNISNETSLIELTNDTNLIMNIDNNNDDYDTNEINDNDINDNERNDNDNNLINNNNNCNSTVDNFLTNTQMHESNLIQDSQFKIIHWNCNSVKNKASELKQFLIINKPDLLSLNEIKCDKYWANVTLNIENYNLVYKCRNNKGGGVAFLIKKCHVFAEIDLNCLSSNNETEVIGINIIFKKIAHNFFTYYNPPIAKLNYELFVYLQQNFNNYILMGDLNAKSEMYGNFKQNKNGDLLENVLFNLNGMILNTNYTPTFHIYGNETKSDYHSFIDIFYGTPNYVIESYNVIKSDLIDSFQPSQYHSAIELNIKLDQGFHQSNTNSLKRMYEKANWSNFVNDLDKFKIIITTETSLDNHLMQIITSLKESIDNNIPLATINSSNRAPLPKYILEMIKIRNRKQRVYRKNRTESNREKYYNEIKTVKNEITKFNSRKWNNFINKIGPCPLSTKAYWKRINRVRNKKQQNKFPNLMINNTLIDTDEEKAKAFGSKLFRTFNNQIEDTQTFNEHHQQFIDNFINNELYFDSYIDKQVVPITLEELNEALNKTKNKTSEDLYGISNFIIKRLPDNFKLLILNFFNLCLIKNYLPSDWKSSIITMIPKKGDTHDIKSYRPISTTACLMKTLEKIISSRLKHHLKLNNVIIKQQSGFRDNRQTKDNIYFMSQKILEAFGKKKKVCCILFDIQSAFDKVWHNGLIYKLYKINTPFYMLEWLKNFLQNRQFRVKVGEYMTESYNITCGVPQGAVLSPTLFSIFINDIPISSKKNENYSLLFADDLAKIIIFDKINENVNIKINKELSSLQSWLTNWRLKMAPEKCSYTIFSLSYKSGDKGTKGVIKEELNLSMYNKSISKNNEPLFLGMRFDKYMCFKNQVKYLKKSCNDRLNIIKVLSHKSWNIDTFTLLNLYKSLVRSLLDYSIFIYPLISKTNKKKLQAIQNNAIRIIFKKRHDELTVEELHNLASLETLNERNISLRHKYLNSASRNLNPLIVELRNDFDEYQLLTNRNFNIKTLLTF